VLLGGDGIHGRGLSKFGLVTALAQGTSDYKALVCIFLFGGNDSNNMIIPFDSAGYKNYQTIRSNLALAQATLLPLQTGTLANYAIHRACPSCNPCSTMTRRLATLVTVGRVVAASSLRYARFASVLVIVEQGLQLGHARVYGVVRQRAGLQWQECSLRKGKIRRMVW